MACGCQSACGCNVVAGAGISILRTGDTFTVTNTGATPPAADVTYDNTASGLLADDVQEAIDELAAMPAPVAAVVFQFENADAVIDPATTHAVMTSFAAPGNVTLELPPAIAGGRLEVWNNDDTFSGNGGIIPQGADTWHYSAALYVPSPTIIVPKRANLYCVTTGEWIIQNIL